MAYLFDSNILRHYSQGHQRLLDNLNRISRRQILIPIIVYAEQLKGRIEALLKADPQTLLVAQQRLALTQNMLNGFSILHFDVSSVALADQLKRQIKSRKRHADLLIAAQALAGRHILVTRNIRDFDDLVPARYLHNWIDDDVR